jgi:hypothetical protein
MTTLEDSSRDLPKDRLSGSCLLNDIVGLSAFSATFIVNKRSVSTSDPFRECNARVWRVIGSSGDVNDGLLGEGGGGSGGCDCCGVGITGRYLSSFL